jgi:transcriptional regulator with XRE-family HTH domain
MSIKNIDSQENILERIRIVRGESGLKQTQFADKIGISQSTLSEIERGKYFPSEASLKLLESEFCISDDWLKRGEGPMLREETLGEYTVRTHGTNPVVKSVRAGWKNETPAPQPQTSEPDQRVAEPPKRMRPEELAAKCGFLLDFFNDALDGDSYAIDRFLDEARNKYLKADPNYRRWTYQKEAEAEERRKKRSGESGADTSLEVKSANGN